MPYQLSRYTGCTDITGDNARVVSAADTTIPPFGGARYYQLKGNDNGIFPQNAFWNVFDLHMPINERNRFLTYYCRITDHPSGIAKMGINGLLSSGDYLSDAPEVVDQYGHGISASNRGHEVSTDDYWFYAFDLTPWFGDTLDKILVEYADPSGWMTSSFEGYFDIIRFDSIWGGPPDVDEINLPSRIVKNDQVTMSLHADEFDWYFWHDTLTFEWSAEQGTVSGEGSQVTYQAPATAQSDVLITCVIKDLGGHVVERTKYVDIIESMPHGCPTFYVRSGSRMVKDNVILTESEDADRERQPVVDYCPLTVSPDTSGGSISIRLAEEEDEVSFIDQVELLAVPYSLHPGEELAIRTDGRLVAVSDPVLLWTANDHEGAHPRQALKHEDGQTYEHFGPGWLAVCFPNVDSIFGFGQGKDLRGDCPGGGLIVDPPDKNLYKTVSSTDLDPPYPGNLITVEFPLPGGQDPVLVGKVCPRINPTIPVLNDLTALVPGDRQPAVFLKWEGYFRADQLAFYGYRPIVEGRAMQYQIAEDIRSGESVVDVISRVDDEYLTVKPGDVVQVDFNAPRFRSNNIQYVLKTTGYYVSASDTAQQRPELPEEPVADMRNHPNPFNAGTEISFSLARASHVTVRVFNVLGQAVTTLHDGELQAGPVTLFWDGRSESGDKVASGVYFYRVETDHCIRTKKMLMVK